MAKDVRRSSESDPDKLKRAKIRKDEIYSHSGEFLPPEILTSGMKKYSSRREIVGYVLMAVLVVAIIVAAVFAMAIVFKLRQVEITKSDDFPLEYKDNYIIDCAGLSGYNNLLFVDTDTVAANIKKNISFAGVSSVKKSYPSKIKIELCVQKPSYYTLQGDAYYALDDDFIVLSKTNDIDSLELDRAIYLRSGKISRCMMGEKIAFSDIDMEKILTELDVLLEKYRIKSMCTEILIDSKFDISFMYQDRLQVKLGDLYDLDIKLQFFEGIYEKLDGTDSAVIDISDRALREAIVTKYN